MIKDGVVADTSVLIDFLKGTEPVSSKVEYLIKENRIIVTGVVLAELLQGVRNKGEEYKILVLSEVVEIMEIPTNLWIKAGIMSSSLRKKGISLPLTDVAIATLAIEYDLPVFTHDWHFRKIPGVKLYKF